MTKTCPACGFVSNAEARFCRMCGALLPRANESGEHTVSPIAATVPLTGPDAGTDALSPHDTGSPNRPHTSDIRRHELDELLRRSPESEPRAHAPAATRAAEDRAPEDEDLTEEADDGSRPLRIRVRPIEHIPNATPTGPPPARLEVASAELDRAATDADQSGPDPSHASRDLTHASHDLARVGSDLPRTSSELPRAGASSPLAGASSTLAGASSTLAAESSTGPAASSSTGPVVSPPRAGVAPRNPTEARAMRVWLGAAVFAVVALVVAGGLVLAWYAARRWRTPSAADAGAPSIATAPPAAGDAKQGAAAKLKEADDLIGAGRADEATARLREAAALDPADPEPHRRLARLLLASGSRRTAIEELQAVTRLAPDDASAWRDLAAAQSAEGSYAAAAESYHTLFGLSGEATADDRLQLAYADALRQSGRAREAQSLYKRLANSRVAEVARASREQLGDANANANDSKNANGAANANQTASASNSANEAARPAETPRTAETPRAAETPDASAQARPTPATLPAAASPRDHYERGVQLWRTNRAAALVELGAASQRGNADADYYLGLNLAEGRDPRALGRGQLLAALSYFQRARRSRFASEARRYEDALVKEYDRRRTLNDQ